MAENMNNDHNPINEKPLWKSLEEREQLPELLQYKHNEFGTDVKEEFDPQKNLSGFSRRKFLSLIGASAAFAAAGCSDYPDKGEIVPYSKKPDEITLGRANYYASTCSACKQSCGILIKTREGRPIKVDGNPDHPVNSGKICAKGQAHILNLYDPSRLTDPYINNSGRREVSSWNSIDAAVIASLKKAGNKEIAIVTTPVVSPSFAKLLQEFTKTYPSAKVYQYEQFAETTRLNAWKKCYGSDTLPVVNLEKVKVLLTLEADILGVEGNTPEQILGFTRSRNIENTSEFSRLYSVESNMSLTGMNADHRLRLKPEAQFEFVLALINELRNKGLGSQATTVTLQDVSKKYNLDKKLLASLVSDLLENKGKAYIYAGRVLDENLHIAVNYLNELIGSQSLYSSVSVNNFYSSENNLKSLTDKLKSGNVEVVIHVEVNPVFTLPKTSGYAEALQKASCVIQLTAFDDETSSLSKYVLAINHDFESWGDASVREGVLSTKQPVIAPIYNTRQKEAILLTWIKGDPQAYSVELYHQYVMKNWEDSLFNSIGINGQFTRLWNSLLHDGVAGKPIVNKQNSFNNAVLSLSVKQNNAHTFGLLILESYSLADGRFAQNGWLQELPHPVSKITWDNYAALSYKTSKELGVKTHDLVEIQAENTKITLPVLVQPGMADNIIAVETGYGRSKGPVVAQQVGQNVNDFLSGGFYLPDVKVSKTGGSYKLASTQDHHTYDEPLTKDLHKKREIVREGTVEEYRKKPGFIQDERKPQGENMYKEFEYKDVKWGMAIDLNKCIGCSNCSLACSVENNVPIVGKDQVLLSREMQWLRIDRY
ncbi:MAG: TAT-variant-translocated molybdopterin oxidoreductase, partial [Ignavibacteria bacterium]|nr:TAT-variant-translocated molybdopterin oxidoreductase [Ignavibacteria bacterium]